MVAALTQAMNVCAGESYAGIYIPLLAQNLLMSNQANNSNFNLQVSSRTFFHLNLATEHLAFRHKQWPLPEHGHEGSIG